MNEAFALNTADAVALVNEYGIVALKADKSREAPEVDALLVELGNAGKGIPFYAIFSGSGGDPVTADGIISKGQILRLLKEAGPSRHVTAERTAMKAP